MTRAERRRAGAAAVALLLAVLTGCSQSAADLSPGGSAEQPERPEAKQVHSYVALGDSYTAAPFVPVTDLAGGCFRSSGSYPALLAKRLGVGLVDVSCSGADTGDVTRRQSVALGRGTVPPQIRAVRPGTDLVTLGIGGNDEGLYRRLVRGCTRLAERPGSPCADWLRRTYGDPLGVLREIGANVSGVLERVHRAAPDAVVVLVGYPRLVDPAHGCDLMPLAVQDRGLLAGLASRLNRVLAHAARSAGARFVDMFAASKGHEVCSADPWVNGRVTDENAALAYHPFAVEQRAVADAVLETLAADR